MSFEPGESEAESNEEQMGTAPSEMASEEVEEEPSAESPEVSGEARQAPSQAGGRRTQLRIVRESIQALQVEVGRYRKSHEATAKKLEAQVATLRKELAFHARSQDLGAHTKSHVSDTKRLEKQMASLRSDLSSLKSQMAKEAAKSRAREEAALSKIIAKVKAPRPAKKAQASKKKR